jgi:ribosomal protein S27AE
MQLLLTDRLSCPRCGPGFGVVLLAHHLRDRRVRDGILGCPNCRDSFAVVDGFADLREPPRGLLPPGLAGSPSEDAAEGGRIAALLGVPRGPGTVALVGEPARFATLLADMVPELDVVAVDGDTRTWTEHPAVSRIVSAPGLPFFSGVLRGAVVDGRLGDAMVFEAARVTASRGRTVVVHAPESTPAVLEAAGLGVLAAEAGTVVAARG